MPSKHTTKLLLYFRLVFGLLGFALLLGWALAMRPSPPATTEVSAIVTPSTAIANTAGSWQVSLVFNADSMATGGGVKVRFVKGFERVQNSNPGRTGYVSARASNPEAQVAIAGMTQEDAQAPWTWDSSGWTVTALLNSGVLRRGDSLHVIFGANAPRGLITPPLSSFVDSVLIAYDLKGDGSYRELKPSPKFEIVPGPSYQLAGYLPTIASAGENALLKIVVLDENFNPAGDFSGTISLTVSTPAARFSRTVALAPSDSGSKIVEVSFDTPGIYSMQLQAPGRSPDSSWNVRTNPVKIISPAPRYRVYWGDLHSHSAISVDGHGTGSFEYARKTACLDFYALTDHTSNARQPNAGITTEEWEFSKREVVRFHEPGKFVTFPGYEFSAWQPSGHHNIFFNAPDELIAQVPLFRSEDFGQVQNVWKKREILPPGMDMITIPHHTGMMWNRNNDTHGPWVFFGKEFSHAEMRPLIEIYSHHGTSELYDPQHPLSYETLDKKVRVGCKAGPHYAQDAWVLEEKLGVIASSDDHSARPGLPWKGLAAVYATALTREAVFEALKQRRTYATTGQRLLLNFELEGAMMGAQIKLGAGEFPTIHVEAASAEDLDYLEVLRWDRRQSRDENGRPIFAVIRRIAASGRELSETFIDSAYAESAIYYVRVKQQRDIYDRHRGLYRQVWAWSSPIWVNEPAATPVDGEDDKTGGPPRRLQLARNQPNPFRESTAIVFYLPIGGKVEAVLYNALGQSVRTFSRDFQSKGWHHFQVNATGLAQGVYFLQLQAAGEAATQKILMLR